MCVDMFVTESPLHLACELGFVDIVLELLACGADVNRTNWYGMTAVWKMAVQGKLDILNLLLQHPDVDITVPSGDSCCPTIQSHTTPLIMAARESRTEVAALLCQHSSSDVNLTDRQGRTALHYAACNGNDEMTAILIQGGASSNSVDEDGITPLYTACKHGHTAVVRRILLAGADKSISMSSRSNNNGFYPLHIAVLQCHIDVVRLLCHTNPAMVDTRTVTGKTPLILACHNGRRDIVLFLLRCGADPNANDSFHQTPLLYALSHGIQKDTFKHISTDDKHGNIYKDQLSLDGDSTNNNPRYSDHEVVAVDEDNNEDDFSILEHLIHYGASVNTMDIHQQTCGFYSITKGTLPHCVVMMKFGADIHPFDPHSFSKMANCEKLKALIQIDLRFRNIAKTISVEQLLDPALERYLEHELMNPPSLKVQCRHAIRKTLLRKQFGALHKQTQELPIPKLLKWYILLNDICYQFDVPSKYT
ncbi:serine/threonine-protein phosphatase 6 regulatory ankyrin repeat subunit B-like isoform X2 [Mizuhopecten yessoensis]|uniref:serine/threonine-protein phosphatase 6 regulatory ankyrin repeat subunit B-like isoform X2 n=1 Tax=Mizuhopecten yessoensis TaxID=6573 RepID=UPI000B459F64|nr:serine/threonine-protein phosphatase 6 regulatory ankyrin repeat subunit B-like isoform X2 [Mizuhopecten yessoensis]